MADLNIRNKYILIPHMLVLLMGQKKLYEAVRREGKFKIDKKNINIFFWKIRKSIHCRETLKENVTGGR